MSKLAEATAGSLGALALAATQRQQGDALDRAGRRGDLLSGLGRAVARDRRAAWSTWRSSRATAWRSSPARGPSGRSSTSARCAPARRSCPIYHTNSPAECRYILEHAGARACSARTRRSSPSRAGPRRAARLEHVDRASGEAAGAITLAELRGQGATASRRRTARRAVAGRHRDDRLHVRHHRPAQGLRAHPRELLATVEMYANGSGSARAARSSTCSCRSRTSLARVTQLSALERAGRSSSGAATRGGSSTSSPRPRPTHFPAVPADLEKVHTRRARRGGRAERAAARRLPLGAARGRAARPQRAARHARPLARAAPRRSPTGSCSRRSARCSATGSRRC